MIINTKDLHDLIKANKLFNPDSFATIALEESLRIVEKVAKETGMFLDTLTNSTQESAS